MFVMAQSIVLAALALFVFGMSAFALVDAFRYRADAFVAAGKLTRTKWLVILAIATALAFACLPSGWAEGQFTRVGLPSIFAVAAAVAAAVYLVDVRPALRQIRGRGGNRGGNSGPYGPW